MLIRRTRTDTKLRPQCNAFGKSMQKNWSKIANSWLKRPPKFSALSGLNFGTTATWNSGMKFFSSIVKFSRPKLIRDAFT